MSLLVGISLLLTVTTATLAHLFAAGMRRTGLGQQIRKYGPNIHEKKSGTPTMGGIVILLVWVASALAIHYWWQPLSWKSLFVVVAGFSLGLIGLADDLLSLWNSRSLGLSAGQKVVLTTAVSLILFFSFPQVLHIPVQVPFSHITLSLSPLLSFFLLWGAFMATANSMNLTDGLDGLATGVSILILCGYLIFSLDGEFYWTIIPLLGILAGFLWVNAYPAQLFLGDVGAFALGGVVAAIALVSGTALILPLLAGLLVVESASVILQVAYFKFTGRRIFKISPFHHHFEHITGIDYVYLLPKLEWAEPKIIIRLWILQVLFVGLAIIAVRV